MYVAECVVDVYVRGGREGGRYIGARTQGPRTDSRWSTSAGWDGVISERWPGGRHD